jgi:hypothetical protein
MRIPLRQLALTCLIFISAAALQAADDPFLGLWKINLAKSKYQSPPPITNTFKYEPAPNAPPNSGWLKVTVTQVDGQGQPNSHDRIETYDGKRHPVVNDPGAEEVLVTRVDPHTIQGSNWKKGKIVVRFTRVVAQDGNTLTTTVDGVNAQGKRYRDVRVFDKQ